jgi:hypothetical protein
MTNRAAWRRRVSMAFWLIEWLAVTIVILIFAGVIATVLRP